MRRDADQSSFRDASLSRSEQYCSPSAVPPINQLTPCACVGDAVLSSAVGLHDLERAAAREKGILTEPFSDKAPYAVFFFAPHLEQQRNVRISFGMDNQGFYFYNFIKFEPNRRGRIFLDLTLYDLWRSNPSVPGKKLWHGH